MKYVSTFNFTTPNNIIDVSVFVSAGGTHSFLATDVDGDEMNISSDEFIKLLTATNPGGK